MTRPHDDRLSRPALSRSLPALERPNAQLTTINARLVVILLEPALLAQRYFGELRLAPSDAHGNAAAVAAALHER